MTKRKIKKDPISNSKKINSKNILYILLIIFVFALFYNQFVTLEKLSNAVNPIARFGTITGFFEFLNKYSSRIFDGTDTFIFYFIILIPIILVILEYRKKYLSDFIEHLPKSNKYMILYLSILSILCMRYYFALGKDMYMGDASYFFFMTKLLVKNFKDFNFFPFWSNMYGGGAPANQFYGPLHPYIAGFITLFTNDIYFSTKLTLFLFHLLSVIGVYLFINQLTGSKKSAFIAGLSAILLYHHPHVIIFPGRYGIASIWGVYPFLFYFFERYLNKKSIINFIALAIIVHLMILASLGMSLYFLFFFGLYALMRIILKRKNFKSIFQDIISMGLVALFGIILSSYYLYSFVSESKWIMEAGTFGTGKVAGRDKNIFLQTFLWNNYQISLFNIQYAWQASYFGLSLIILGILGLFLTVKNKIKKFFPFIGVVIIILFYIIGYGQNKLLLKIPYAHTYSLVRSFNILTIVIIFLSGIGFYILNKKYKNRLSLFLIIGLIMLIDLFPTTFHDTFGKQYGDYGRPFMDYLIKKYKPQDNKTLNFRVDLLGSGARNSRAIHCNWRPYDAFIPETGIPLVFESGADYLKVDKFIWYFHKGLYRNYLTLSKDLVLNFYHLFNTKYLISSFNLPPSFFKAYAKNKTVQLFQLENHTPVLLTSQLKKVEYSTNQFPAFLNSLDIDRKNNTMKEMWIINGSSENLKSKDLSFQLKKHIIKENKVQLDIETHDTVFAVLSYSAYPTIKVLINQKEVEHYETLYGFIVVKLQPGLNQIEIIPTRTVSANLFFYLSLLLFFLLISIILIILYTQRKKKGKS